MKDYRSMDAKQMSAQMREMAELAATPELQECYQRTAALLDHPAQAVVGWRTKGGACTTDRNTADIWHKEFGEGLTPLYVTQANEVLRAALVTAQKIIEREYPNGQAAIDIRNALALQPEAPDPVLSGQRGGDKWQPMGAAPRERDQPVLLKFKDAIPNDREDVRRWEGLIFVGSWHGPVMDWGFAAPVGMGGFPDEWLEGWRPLSTLHIPGGMEGER